jgi:TolA-binding protein
MQTTEKEEEGMLHRQRHRWTMVVFWGLLAACADPGSSVFAQASKAAKPVKPANSPPEALNVYSDAANFQNNGAFELAADEWEKFLKNYPQDPLAAKAQHYVGVCYLQLKQLAKAAAAFDAVVKKYPDFDLIQDAYLNLGWCQYSLGGQQTEGAYAKAAATFAELVKKFPDGKHTEQALFYAGEAEYNLGKKKEAVAAYDQLVKKYPQASLRSDALYALGVTHEELGQHAAAGQAYDLFLQEFATHDLANEVQMRKAETVLLAGDFAAAEKLFGQIAMLEGFAAADHALYRQAFCLSKLDKFAEAAKLYARIPAEFAQSAYAADAAMSAGRCYYRVEQLADASGWFQKVIEGSSNSRVEAAHWLCRIYLRDGKPQQAIDLAKQVLPAAGNDPFAIHLELDHADALYESQASRPEAVALYVKIATGHPQHELAAQSLYNAAFGALELGRYDEGLKHAAAFLEAYPNQRLAPDVQYVAAECHLQRNEHAEAEKLYAQLIQGTAEHPDRETWQVRLGLAIYLQKKYADAVAALEPLVGQLKNADNQAQAQFVLGVSRFYLDQFDGAVQALQASGKANPTWKQADEALLFLARALRRQDKTAEAIKTLAKLIADFPRSRLLDQAHYRYGEFSYALEDYKTAIAQYDAVVAADAASPFAPYAVYGKGWAQLKSKAYPAAVESFRALIKGHPEHALVADTHLALGMSLRQAGEQAEAVKEIDLYLSGPAAEPNKSDALYERGLAEVALKNFGKAAETFQQLLTANPQYAAADKVAYELAWAYKSMPEGAKKAESAATFAELAAKHSNSPLAAEANFHVGESHYENAEYVQAAQAYTAAKQKSSPGELREKATYKLGWSLFQDKKYQEALDQFAEQATDQPKGDLAADALFMKAECLFRLEKYAEALPVYLATREVKLASPVSQVLALLHGGQSALQTENWEQAVTLLSQIPEQHTDSPYLAEAYCELGRAKQNSGKEADAVSDYEKAAELSRAEVGARARFMVGELTFARKEFAEAIRHFQRVMFGYGGEAAAPETKKWQAKAGFEAARCAEVQIKDAQGPARAELQKQAQQAYQYVIDKHPQDEMASQAKKRLEELTKL